MVRTKIRRDADSQLVIEGVVGPNNGVSPWCCLRHHRHWSLGIEQSLENTNDCGYLLAQAKDPHHTFVLLMRVKTNQEMD